MMRRAAGVSESRAVSADRSRKATPHLSKKKQQHLGCRQDQDPDPGLQAGIQKSHKLAPEHFISKASRLKLDLFNPLGDESFQYRGNTKVPCKRRRCTQRQKPGSECRGGTDAHYRTCGIYSDGVCVTAMMQSLAFCLPVTQGVKNIRLVLVQQSDLQSMLLLLSRTRDT
ncbi:Hypothetical predicted protein [Xyrichtys novacula]|uniref:Uncharacterized protein n=1 Tax=Xyrichtys novacula TaxID=13765 RepID=A0AAV1ENC3_XYRNO|nr:Hypothetical predicted protein [Xyrichtys novacula]